MAIDRMVYWSRGASDKLSAMSHEHQYKQATMEQRQIIYQSVETKLPHIKLYTSTKVSVKCRSGGLKSVVTVSLCSISDPVLPCVCEPVALTQKHQVKLISFSCSWQMNWLLLHGWHFQTRLRGPCGAAPFSGFQPHRQTRQDEF